MKGNTALLTAASMGDKRGVQLLLDGGTNMQDSDNERHNVLACAANHGHGDMVKWLLDYAAEPDNRPSASAEVGLHPTHLK